MRSSRSGQVGIRVLFMVLVFVLCLPAAEPQAKAPRVEFREVDWNFGRIKQGEVVIHEFVFRNAGNAILIVNKVSTSCGCAAALVSQKKIAPGQEGRIKVTFDSKGYSGQVAKYIYFESNDPKNPRLELVITALVETGPAPRIELEPYNLDLGLVLEGETSEARIKVRNSGQLELVFDIDNPDFVFMVGERKIRFPYKLPAGREIELKAQLPVRQGRTGLQREYVLIKSNDPARPTQSIFISRYVVNKEELRRLFEKYARVLGIK